MTLYQLVSTFYLYAFLGWCIEVAFQAVRHKKFINRGFLSGPVCPIYGFGMGLTALCLAPFEGNIALTFLIGAAITTAVEFIAGFLMLRLFHARWWDYSKQPLNIGGFVCLKFSLAWGVLCVGVMRVAQPFFMGILAKLPRAPGVAALCVFTALLLTDFAATLSAVRRLNERLRLLSELQQDIRALSDGVGQRVADAAIAAAGRAQETRARVERDRAELAQKREAFLRLLSEKRFGHARLLRAFPSLSSEGYQEALHALRQRWAEKPAHKSAPERSGQPEQENKPERGSKPE